MEEKLNKFKEDNGNQVGYRGNIMIPNVGIVNIDGIVTVESNSRNEAIDIFRNLCEKEESNIILAFKNSESITIEFSNGYASFVKNNNYFRHFYYDTKSHSLYEIYYCPIGLNNDLTQNDIEVKQRILFEIHKLMTNSILTRGQETIKFNSVTGYCGIDFNVDVWWQKTC